MYTLLGMNADTSTNGGSSHEDATEPGLTLSARQEQLILETYKRLTNPENPFARRIVSDETLRTFEYVRTLLREIGWDTELTIPTNIAAGENEREDDLAVPVADAVALLATARVALDWDRSKKTPFEAGATKAISILTSLSKVPPPPFAHLRLNANDLYKADPIWGGLVPLSAYPPSLGNPWDKPLPPHALESRQKSTAEALLDQPEYKQIAAIVHTMLLRIQDLCGEDSERMRLEMRDWRRWETNIVEATHEDVPLMRTVYQKIMIPDRKLLRLTTNISGPRKKAKDEIQRGGGFLHDCSDADLEFMIGKGETRVVRADPDNPQSVFGYYSVVSQRDHVDHLLGEMCGYEPGTVYTPETLPQRSRSGWKLQWPKPKDAADLLNAPEELSVSIEVAVGRLDESSHPYQAGVATALKHAVYESVLRQGRSLVLLRFFEILEVNGVRVDSVINVPSRQFIQALGGRPIGFAEETFDRNGIRITVLWNYWLSDLRESLDIIDQKSQKE